MPEARTNPFTRDAGFLRRIPALTGWVMCALMIVAPLGAQAPLTLDDVRGLRSIPWFGLSPDGSRVAYLLSTPGESSDLWIVPSGGGAHVQLTRGMDVRTVAGWNSEGDRIAYVAPEGEQTSLWIVDPGSAPRVACPLPRGARLPAWLADGKRLTFAARAEARTGPGSSNRDAEPASPGEAVFLCDPDTGAVSQVTARGYHGLDFAWAPDGDRVAISFQERPGFYEGLETDLLLVDARTGVATPLVTRPGIDGSPMWSPDGTQIAFISGFGRSGLLPNLGVAVVSAREPATPRDVGAAHDRGGFFEGPFLHAWSPDSRQIFYSVVDGLEAPLFRVPAQGGTFARVPVPADEGEVAYQFSLSADGRSLAFKTPPRIGRPRSSRCKWARHAQSVSLIFTTDSVRAA